MYMNAPIGTDMVIDYMAPQSTAQFVCCRQIYLYTKPAVLPLQVSQIINQA